MNGSIFGVIYFARCMFAPESTIASFYLLGEVDGVSILLIKLFLGALILILFITTPNHHSHLFSVPPTLLLY